MGDIDGQFKQLNSSNEMLSTKQNMKILIDEIETLSK
jgi:hypothetical protein